MNLEMKIPFQPDEDGYLGRECPDCKSYFKVIVDDRFDRDPSLQCPHCGHKGDLPDFLTKEQENYALSVGFNQIFGNIINDLRKSEFSYQGGGIEVSLKFEGTPPPIQHYREKRLETRVVCQKCNLHYSIYGVFAFCPSCGSHNSQQILEKNLDLTTRQLDLAKTVEADLAEYLIGDALENVVSTFDGFGHEVCTVFADKTTTPTKAAKTGFQNLHRAKTDVQKHFGFDIAASLTPAEWEEAIRGFQKRHLLAHKSGVIDDDYIAKANDPSAIKGRKVSIKADEIVALIDIVRKLGAHIVQEMNKLP